jgi:predicted HTH domain antitoxin
MQSIKIEIELPGEVARYVDYKNTDYRRRAREILLYQLVKEDKISFGKAAEILGMRKIDFITQLGKMGIPYFDGDFDEISADIENLNRFPGEQGV